MNLEGKIVFISGAITARAAVDILRGLLQSMQESGQTQEAAAIDFALDTMKYRYAWINDSMRSD